MKLSEEEKFISCRDEALKYQSRTDFHNGSRKQYRIAHAKGWMDEICSHMIQIRKPAGYWSYEKCVEILKPYEYLVDFVREQYSAYVTIRKNGWSELLKNLKYKRSRWGDWNIKSLCHEEALKYSSRTDFYKSSRGAYDGAKRNGWLDEVCSHMRIGVNITQRYVYEIVKDGVVIYVGITTNPERRFKEHCENKKLDSTHSIRLVCGPIPAQEAQLIEKELIKKYAGLMNITGGGSLGNTKTFLTKSFCCEKAKKYTSRSEFARNDHSAYQTACRKGWIDEICAHMVRKIKPNGYWQNKETCGAEAMRYSTKKEFKALASGAYQAACKNGWVDEFFPKTG